MPKIYTIDGNILDFNIKHKYEGNFFRKMLNKDFKGSKIELRIAKIIKENPHDNIVKVYKVSKNLMFIDYQLLDTDYTIKKKR